MIERLADMPPGTLGFRAAGEIERADHDRVLVPELHRALEGGGLRTLYVMARATKLFAWIDPGRGARIPARGAGAG